MLNDLNLVPAVALIGASMEVSCILVTFNGCSDFTPLFPKLQLSLSAPAEDVHDECAKVTLRRGEGTQLLNVVQQLDHNPTISFLLGEIGFLLSPCP